MEARSTRLVDETGNSYGMLEVISRAPCTAGNRRARFYCMCDCGKMVVVAGKALRDRSTKSCGCGNKDELRAKLMKDETGKRYGRWLVIEPTENRGKGLRWLCRCDCGTVKDVTGVSLRLGLSTSCGCYHAEQTSKRFSLAYGEAAKKSALRHTQWAASKRNYEWRLTDEEAFALFAGNCHYCDSPPSNVSSHPQTNGKFVYSGIDRVDNSRGYEPDNVVSCCTHCNTAKRKRSKADFLAWIARVHAHSNIGKDR